jgi:hypothetical protein
MATLRHRSVDVDHPAGGERPPETGRRRTPWARAAAGAHRCAEGETSPRSRTDPGPVMPVIAPYGQVEAAAAQHDTWPRAGQRHRRGRAQTHRRTNEKPTERPEVHPGAHSVTSRNRTDSRWPAAAVRERSPGEFCGLRPPRRQAERRGCGQGRGRTADLPLFRRSLVPTELPGRDRCCTPGWSDPDGTRTRDLRRDRATR